MRTVGHAFMLAEDIKNNPFGTEESVPYGVRLKQSRGDY